MQLSEAMILISCAIIQLREFRKSKPTAILAGPRVIVEFVLPGLDTLHVIAGEWQLLDCKRQGDLRTPVRETARVTGMDSVSYQCRVSRQSLIHLQFSCPMIRRLTDRFSSIDASAGDCRYWSHAGLNAELSTKPMSESSRVARCRRVFLRWFAAKPMEPRLLMT